MRAKATHLKEREGLLHCQGMPRVQMQCILAKRQSHFQYPRDIISPEKSHVLSQGSDPMSDGHQIYNPRGVRSPEENKSCIISCSTEQVANLTRGKN